MPIYCKYIECLLKIYAFHLNIQEYQIFVFVFVFRVQNARHFLLMNLPISITIPRKLSLRSSSSPTRTAKMAKKRNELNH